MLSVWWSGKYFLFFCLFFYLGHIPKYFGDYYSFAGEKINNNITLGCDHLMASSDFSISNQVV